MFYNKEEKEQIQNKWKHIYKDNCSMCNGTGLVKQDDVTAQCKCMKKAMRAYLLEISNIPINYINVKRDVVEKYIKYDFDNYFNIILNEAFKTKNLFLFDLPLDINTIVITYISKRLITEINTKTKQRINLAYMIYENLIQLSLRSNADRDARDRLNRIICKPDILFIDNLGIETGFGSSSKHNVKLLQLILKERRNRLKSTIISSKLYYDDLERQYGRNNVEMLVDFDVVKGNNYE